MGVGETLDAAIKLYRFHWKALIMIAAAIVIPFDLISGLIRNIATRPVVVGGQLYVTRSAPVVLFVLALLGFFVQQPLLRGATARAVAEIYMGSTPTPGGSLRAGLRKLAPLALVVLVASSLEILGLLALVVPGIILIVRYSFAAPAVVVEDHRAIAALSRSWRLTRGVAFRVFGTTLLAAVLAGIVSLILVVPGTVLYATGALGTQSWILQATFTALAGTITAPFTTIVVVLLYFDARIRKEGLDLAVMAQEVAATRP
jgi:hypothetical protein